MTCPTGEQLAAMTEEEILGPGIDIDNPFGPTGGARALRRESVSCSVSRKVTLPAYNRPMSTGVGGARPGRSNPYLVAGRIVFGMRG